MIPAVEQLRNNNRTAERESVLIPFERRRRRYGCRKCERPGIEIIVTEKLEDGAVVGVGARFGRDIDLARFAAEFSGIDARLNLELLKSVYGRQKRIDIKVHVRVGYAIQRVIGERPPVACDRERYFSPIVAGTARGKTCVRD